MDDDDDIRQSVQAVRHELGGQQGAPAHDDASCAGTSRAADSRQDIMSAEGTGSRCRLRSLPCASQIEIAMDKPQEQA